MQHLDHKEKIDHDNLANRTIEATERRIIRMKVEGDRLSNLPDDLIFKILSFISTKHAVKTSALSSRWRYIWTKMPSLNFSSMDFRTLVKFSKSVTHVLSRRNNLAEVLSVKLTFCVKVGDAFMKRISNKILNYAFSHNVQQLDITCPDGNKIESPLSVFSSQSLKHLTLMSFTYQSSFTTPRTWELPALTTLNLYGVTLYGDSTDKSAGFFSNCANLNNLTLESCTFVGLNGFDICHPGLCNLTINYCSDFRNVVTPKLKNLTITDVGGTHLISAPNIVSLNYKGYFRPCQLSSDLLHLEKVDICISCFIVDEEDAQKLVSLLQQLQSVKFLTLNTEIIEFLSLHVELISHQPSPFENLKSLKIYPYHVNPEGQTEPKVSLSTEVRNYLLDGSSGVTFTMVSHEEARAVKNVVSTQNLMRELQMQLDLWKENSETNMALMESHVAKVDDQMETKARITSYWEYMIYQLQEGHIRSDCTTSMLQRIEEVLTKLPASHRAKLQPRFSGLRAEADTIVDNIMDHLKIQCDNKPRFKCLPFDELTTTSQPSS